ncbi:MAG: hypothetical protein ACRD8U_02340 [Pyrinomonadaceae bacterium]
MEVDLPDVDAGIKALLSNPACATFVTSLINATATATQNEAHSTNGVALYGMIRAIVFEKQFVGGREAGGTVSGSISRHGIVNPRRGR